MADEMTEATERALKWIDHNLLLAERLMKSSSDEGNGRANFSAHDAHQALTVAKKAIGHCTGTLVALREGLRREIIDTPETADFMMGVPIEAAHQRDRWGASHDEGKSPFDWFWLIGYLAQKAAASAVEGNTEKALHHTISTAAALANWHAAIAGTDTAMRPGIRAPLDLDNLPLDVVGRQPFPGARRNG